MAIRFGDLIFDADRRQVWCAGTEVRLSPKAFDLLALLIEQRPRPVSKADIHERLWPGTFVSSSSLPSLVSEVREAIADRRRKPPLIRTLHSVGYSFMAEETPTGDGTLASAVANGWLIGDVAEIALTSGDNVLGREGAGIILLKSSTVSRRHARIRIGADGAIVEDLGSKNGTYVNDRRVTAPTPVVDGNQVRIGSLLFTFRLPQSAGSTETLSSQSGLRSRR